MSIEAVAAFGSPAGGGPAQHTPGVATTQAASLPGEPSASGRSDFAEALGKIHDRMSQSGLGGARVDDPVSRQVQELLPSPWKESAAARVEDRPVANAVTTPDGAHEALQRSFDHAIFVSLVGQVMGGVSKSTSTLIHQS